MTSSGETRCFDFAGFRVDPAQRRLFGRDGEPIELPARAFDLLVHMVERPGELLDKPALLRAVWPTTVVEEGNLSQSIFTLRRALGETAGDARFIVTVPGRGYQFVAEVTIVTGEAGVANETGSPEGSAATHQAPSNPSARWKLRALALPSGTVALGLLAVAGYLLWHRAAPLSAPESVVVSAPAPLRTIAVLPFADLSAAKDMEYFSDGLAEELVNSLAKVNRLRVVGRRSAFNFRGKNEDVRSVGEKLGVASVLEGSIRKEGNRIRIAAQLLRTSDGFSLWAGTYDRKLDDVLDVQGEIANKVAAALDPLLGDHVAPVARLTNDADAYSSYLRGLSLYSRQTAADVSGAVDEFQRAVNLDPKFAIAHARLARAYEWMALNTAGDNAQLHALANASVDRALKLDPTLADVWWMLWFAERQNTPLVFEASRLQRALIANPDDAEAMSWLARTYQLMGRHQEELAMLEQAYEADPYWVPSILQLAKASYRLSGDRTRLLKLADVLDRVAPGSAFSSSLRARLAFIEGRPLDWDRWVAQAVELAPRDLPVQGYLSLDYSILGEVDAALHHARLCQVINPKNAAGWYNVAHIHLVAGNIAAARPVVQEVMKLHPTDYLALRARAELQYFEHDCAGSIESLVLAQPELGQQPASLDVVNEVESVPMLTWCQRMQGNETRARELAHAFELAFTAPTAPGELDGLRARMAAAMGDRGALISHLGALARTKSMLCAFTPHEPMIQAYLQDPQVKKLLDTLEARRAEWRRILPKTSVRVPVPGLAAAQDPAASN